MNSIEQQAKTGGRKATNGVIPGRVALSVGKPDWVPPKGWSWVKLTDVARLETGHTPSRRHPECWNGDIPWIGIKDATGNHGREIDDTAQHVTQLGIENSSARILPAKTVCLSRTASLGYVVIMNRPMATSQDFVNWVCSDAIDYRYLASILIAENASFALFSRGTTRQTIYFPEAKAFHVLLPPIEQQKRIADVLWSLYEKIQLNHQTNQTLEQIAQALFKSWFVDFEPVKAKMAAKARWQAVQPSAESASPVCYADELEPQAGAADLETTMNLATMQAVSGKTRSQLTQLQAEQPDQYTELQATAALFPAGMQESEVGEIPEGWEIKAVSDHLNSVSKTHSLKSVKEVIFLNTGDIHNGKFLHANLSPVENLPGQAKKTIQQGDILFSEIRPENKRFAYVFFNGNNHVVSTKLMVLRQSSEIDTRFLYFIITQQNAIDLLQVLAESRSDTFPQITFNALKSVKFIGPADNKLVTIFSKSILTPFMNTQQAKEEESRRISSLLRDILLPKLLSGELTLPEAEQLAGEATGV